MSGWTSRFGGREWTVDGAELVSRDPGTGVRSRPHRTAGEPVTCRRYLEGWGEEIRSVSEETGVPVPIIVATIATENGAARDGPVKGLRVLPPRRETGYESDRLTPHRISVGPCHVLISTARAAMGDPSIDRDWLLDLRNNLLASFRALVQKNERWGHGYDPILAPACYNSGGIHNSSSPRSIYHNRWHLRSTGDHLDRFADWYGDALAVCVESVQESTHTPRDFSGPTIALAGVDRQADRLTPLLPVEVRSIAQLTPEVVRAAALQAGEDPHVVVRGAQFLGRLLQEVDRREADSVVGRVRERIEGSRLVQLAGWLMALR